MRVVTWNMKSPYRAVSLKSVARELAKPNLDLMGVQGIRWDRGGQQTIIHFSMEE
jgi:hypothetical protein